MSIKNIKVLSLKCVKEENGTITIIEGLRDLPFKISRIFSVIAPVDSIRGQHAHKHCTQFLTCPHGQVQVVCDDGRTTVNYILNTPEIGILIPSGIWAYQIYQKKHTVLNVICDLPYDENDYIRNYEEYKTYLKK